MLKATSGTAKFREIPLTALTKAVISTDLGDILGSVQTRLDPRQNKTVTWASYYVSCTQ